MKNHRHDEELHRQMAAALRVQLQAEIGKQLKLRFEVPNDLPGELAALIARIDAGPH
jgi:hypothetical protein